MQIKSMTRKQIVKYLEKTMCALKKKKVENWSFPAQFCLSALEQSYSQKTKQDTRCCINSARSELRKLNSLLEIENNKT